MPNNIDPIEAPPILETEYLEEIRRIVDRLVEQNLILCTGATNIFGPSKQKKIKRNLPDWF